MSRFLTVTIAVLFSALGAHSIACTCGGPPGPERCSELEIVFSGKLEAVIEHKESHPQELGGGLVEYKFRVGQVWIGEPAKLLSVYSDESSCGARFEIGRVYFVGASRIDKWNGSLLVTNICDSGPVEYALIARVGLAKSLIVDSEIAVERPNEEQLKSLAAGGDPVIVRFARRALKVIRSN